MKKYANRLLAALLCAALALSLSACGLTGGDSDEEEDDSVKEYQDTIVFALDSEPQSLLGAASGESAAARMVRMEQAQTVCRLVPDESGAQAEAVQFVLVEDQYDRSSDGLTWTFRVREGMQFAKGNEITAEDIAATLRHSGVEELENAAADGATLTITTESPCPELLHLLCSYAAGVYDASYLEQYGEDVNTSAESQNASGPYMLKEWVRGERMILEANPNYHTVSPDGENTVTPNLVYTFVPDEQARFDAMEEGEADLAYAMSADRADMLGSEGFTVLQTTNGGMLRIAFDCGDGVLKDATVRQALAYALDTDALVKELYGKHYTNATGFVSHSVWGYAREGHVPYNVGKCKELLQDAGYPDGFETQLAAPEGFVELAEAVADQLREAGVNARVVTVDGDAEGTAASGESYPMSIGAIGVHARTAGEALDAWRAETPSYQNAQVDELLEQASAELHDDKRLELYHEAMHLLYVDDPAQINLCELMDLTVLSPKLEDAQGDAGGFVELSGARLAQ